jgi:ribokinase
MPKQAISVLATYTDDILVDVDGRTIATQPGGPALFLKQALENDGVSFKDFEKEKLRVKILLDDRGEFGKVSTKPKISKVNHKNLSDWVIISTVLNEWDISCMSKSSKKLFVDLQGYVRNGNDYGQKKSWEGIDQIYKNIFCIAGTEEEVACLPEEVIEDQKSKRTLVITRGSRGTEIFSKGKRYYIPTEEVINLRDTIGAGDTFFGYFVSSLYQGADVGAAGIYASKKTRLFLIDKLNNN